MEGPNDVTASFVYNFGLACRHKVLHYQNRSIYLNGTKELHFGLLHAPIGFCHSKIKDISSCKLSNVCHMPQIPTGKQLC